MKVAIGQDSHRFDFEDKNKKLKLGEIVFEDEPALSGNSDADVILHAITNAVSGITGVNTLKNIGLIATTGEGLTECGKGNGISVFVCITVE